MYSSQQISQRIKQRAKDLNYSIGDMLTYCNLGKNTLNNMNSGRIPLSNNLAVLADYLDCSVDYLLGRTDNPEINK